MRKQIDVKAIIENYSDIALERAKEFTNGKDSIYPYAFGWLEAEMITIMDELQLTTKQKKIMQELVDRRNSTRMKEVKNLMTGEMIKIPYNTPRSCDPSTELYWSM